MCSHHAVATIVFPPDQAMKMIQAMKATGAKLPMKAMKASTMKEAQAKSTKKPMKATKTMKKGTKAQKKPAGKPPVPPPGQFTIVKCTAKKCPSWIWLHRLFQIGVCSFCSQPWWKSIQDGGVQLQYTW